MMDDASGLFGAYSQRAKALCELVPGAEMSTKLRLTGDAPMEFSCELHIGNAHGSCSHAFSLSDTAHDLELALAELDGLFAGIRDAVAESGAA